MTSTTLTMAYSKRESTFANFIQKSTVPAIKAFMVCAHWFALQSFYWPTEGNSKKKITLYKSLCENVSTSYLMYCLSKWEMPLVSSLKKYSNPSIYSYSGAYLGSAHGGSSLNRPHPPQPPSYAHLGKHQGFPKPAERCDLSSVSWVWVITPTPHLRGHPSQMSEPS